GRSTRKSNPVRGLPRRGGRETDRKLSEARRPALRLSAARSRRLQIGRTQGPRDVRHVSATLEAGYGNACRLLRESARSGDQVLTAIPIYSTRSSRVLCRYSQRSLIT